MHALSATLAILAVLAAHPATQPLQGRASAHVTIDDSQSARTIIAGRVVNVEVDVASSAEGSGAQVRLSTIDRRGLPPIAAVRLRLLDRGRTFWSTAAEPINPSMFARFSADYGASDGPPLQPGGLFQLQVDVYTGRATGTVRIPVIVQSL